MLTITGKYAIILHGTSAFWLCLSNSKRDFKTILISNSKQRTPGRKLTMIEVEVSLTSCIYVKEEWNIIMEFIKFRSN